VILIGGGWLDSFLHLVVTGRQCAELRVAVGWFLLTPFAASPFAR